MTSLWQDWQDPPRRAPATRVWRAARTRMADRTGGEGTVRRTFNIRLWFGVTGLGLIAVICAVSAYWVGQFMTRTLLERESEVAQEYLQSIVWKEGGAMFRAATPGNHELLDFVEHVVRSPGVLRANVYGADRRVLWSSEPQLIGRTFSDNPELEAALAGRRVTEIQSIDRSKPEHLAIGPSGRFIEAYLPMRVGGPDGPVVGAIEIYKYPTTVNAMLAEARIIVWALAVGAALLLYAALFWIVQRGARQIEAQQQQLVRLQSFATIGELASAIAHSLRNPMAAIRSTAELWRSELPPDRTEVADDVIREVDRMDAYVRDLLSYARPQPANVRPVDPMAIVETAMAKRRAALGRSAIVLRTADRRSAPSRCRVDPVLLEHALTSLLDNAIEAMPGGGTIDVALADLGRGRRVRLTIADDGPGIPPQLLKQVSESFFTTKSRGLGLGLALARGVIQRWDGELAIASQPGQGTRIAIDLPTVAVGA